MCFVMSRSGIKPGSHVESGKVIHLQRLLEPGTSAGRTSVDIGASAKLELVVTFCNLGDNDSIRPIGDLWRRAFDCGHGVATTRRPSLAMRRR